MGWTHVIRAASHAWQMQRCKRALRARHCNSLPMEALTGRAARWRNRWDEQSTVQRVWAQMRLKPHRLDGYMASDDPDFEKKAADIIGLYLNPPQHAAVFCGR